MDSRFKSIKVGVADRDNLVLRWNPLESSLAKFQISSSCSFWDDSVHTDR